MKATDRLRGIWDSATDEQRELGREWYRNARRVVRRLAKRHGTTERRAAAVMAITSPDAHLLTNVRWTAKALASAGTHPVGRYPSRMVPAVRAVLEGRVAPSTAVTGPKVSAFYRAILGDTSALVLDRWAVRLATGRDNLEVANVAEARAAYEQVAAELGIPPAELQAVIWKVGRDAARKYTDIHEIQADLTRLVY